MSRGDRSRVDRTLDAAGRAVRSVQGRMLWLRRWYVPFTAAGLAVLAVITVFAMEPSAANYDPMYMRVLVERATHTGRSYYTSGVHNKGPLEPLVYEIAGQLGGRDGWWFVIAVFVLIAAAVVGWAAAVVATRVGGSTVVGVCVGVGTTVHLTLSTADYAGVLYARNITTTLLAAAVGLVAFGPAWTGERRRRWAVVGVGLACGLAVQTLLTAVFTAAPILLWAMWDRRAVRVWGRPAWVVLPLVAAAVFLSAPAFYLLTGSWQDFVDGYWTYARYMSTGTGRGLGSQVSLGWDRFVDYYRDRPEVVVVGVAFLVTTLVRLRTLDGPAKGLRGMVAVWWLGAWVELVLSQRYSSHYFSVLAVPTIMLLAVAAGDLTALIGSRVRWRPAMALLPLLTAVLVIDVDGRERFDAGVMSVATVHDVAGFQERREATIDGRTRMLRATLDLVSDEDDPLLMWTSLPWPYLTFERTSATRYIWDTFLRGAIYLGRTSPEFVLPGTWEHFEDDLDDADPVAYVVEASNPIDPDTPFAAAVADRFVDVFDDGEVTLGLRRDVADWLATPSPTGVAVPVLEPGPLTLSPDGCVRLDGTVAADADPFVVELTGVGGPAQIAFTAGGGDVLVESRPGRYFGAVRQFRTDADSLPYSLVVGERAAVLVVAGKVAGAVEIEPGTPVTVTGGADSLAGGGATLSPAPPVTGC